MQGVAAAFDKHIDGDLREGSLDELKWSITSEDGISLPLRNHIQVLLSICC